MSSAVVTSAFVCWLNRCVLVWYVLVCCMAYLHACKRARCLLMERERVDVDVGRCQRHTGAYRITSASGKVSQFGVTCMFLGGVCSVDLP